MQFTTHLIFIYTLSLGGSDRYRFRQFNSRSSDGRINYNLNSMVHSPFPHTPPTSDSFPRAPPMRSTDPLESPPSYAKSTSGKHFVLIIPSIALSHSLAQQAHRSQPLGCSHFSFPRVFLLITFHLTYLWLSSRARASSDRSSSSPPAGGHCISGVDNNSSVVPFDFINDHLLIALILCRDRCDLRELYNCAVSSVKRFIAILANRLMELKV